MFVIGPVAFTFTLGFWIAIAVWAFMYWCMPKRAMVGLVVGFFAAIWYMNIPHTDPVNGQYFYISAWFAFSFIFTCCMSPLAIIAFYVGYKQSR